MKKNGISRRDFLRGTAAGALTVAAAGLLGCGTPAATTTEALETRAPETNAPETKAPETQAPVADAPAANDWLGTAPVIADSDVVATYDTEVVVVGAGTSGLGPLVFRIPADSVGFSVVGKGKLHRRGILGPGILGTEHGGIPALAAGFAKKGEGNGIENRGFTGARIAGDQIQSSGAQAFKVQDLGLRVGTEAGHG